MLEARTRHSQVLSPGAPKGVFAITSVPHLAPLEVGSGGALRKQGTSDGDTVQAALEAFGQSVV